MRARGRGRGRGRGCGRPRRTDTRWHIVKPTVIAVDNPDAAPHEFNVFKFTDDVKHEAQFVLPTPSPRPQDVAEVIMAENMAYYPDKFIEEMWLHTLEHVDSKQIPRCKRFKINVADIFHFFAIVYYFGLVRLPAKADYWKIKDLGIMPTHPVCTARKMTFRRFQYIWTHICAVSPK